MDKKSILGAILAWPLLLHAQGSGQHAMATEVFDRLVQAYGRTEPSVPKLKVTQDPSVIAEATTDGMILVGIRLLDYCRTLGADSSNAMAFVLGHELAHHYNHHFWSSDYGTAFADMEWGKRIDSLGSAVPFREYYETQADDFGMFYSYLAGYNTLELAETILKGIYEYFKLPTGITGYPSMEERITIASMASEKVQEMIPIFEAGKFLLLLSGNEEGEYKNQLLLKSKECFEQIIDRKFVSAEILNNLGVIYLQLGLNYLEEKDYPFVYPILLDEESRLFGNDGSSANPKGQSGFGTSKEYAFTLVKKGIKYLDESTDLDETYGIGYLNAAVGYHLLGQKLDAEYFLYKAKATLSTEPNKDRLSAFCLELEAIMNAGNDMPLALQLWKVAQQSGSAIAAKNQAIAAGQNNSVPVVPSIGGGFSFGQAAETAGGESLQSVYDNVLYLVSAKNRYTVAPGSYFFSYPYKNGEVYIIECNNQECPYTSLVFYEIEEYKDVSTAKGVSLGMTQQEVVQKYGTQFSTISTSTFDYLVFKNSKLLFKMQDGKVVGWILYYFV